MSEKGRKFLKEHEKEIKEALEFAERFRMFSEICGSSIRNVMDVIFKNVKNLSSDQKSKLKQITEEFEKKVYSIVYGGKNEK